MNKPPIPAVDLNFIAAEAESRLAENEAFRTYLQGYPEALDPAVHLLNNKISAVVDCTTCGNCCRTLMINVTSEEADRLAVHLDTSLTELKKTHLEESLAGQLIMNTIPCHFLTENKCSIYSNRFTECREFPGLHRNGFRDRLFSTFMHYGRCPIVYNVLEELKRVTKFVPDNCMEE